MPDAVMPQSSQFWDRIARTYAAKPVSDEAAYQRKLEIMRGHLGADMEVVELGCGTGSTALALAPMVKHLDAIDYSAGMIGIAEEKANAAAVSNVTFACAPADTHQRPANSCDAVLALNLLHLLERRQAVLANIHRWLRPGGIFISSTACIGDMSFFLRSGLGIALPIGRALGFFPFVTMFTRDTLRAELQAAGFTLEQEWQPKPNAPAFSVARRG